MIDHLDAVRDLASAKGFNELFDSGPVHGRLVVFGDDEYTRDFLEGAAVLGTRVEVRFDTNGAIDRAAYLVDGESMQRVGRSNGSAGERLLATLQLLSTAVEDF